mgnify:CR=1 FL=1|jgi:PBP1b-binding outer membrane lipoprotein LpoB
MNKNIRIVFILLVIISLTSCIAVGKGGKQVHNQPTVGQQFIDLQKARDEGAITSKEYEELKDKIKKSPLITAREE